MRKEVPGYPVVSNGCSHCQGAGFKKKPYEETEAPVIRLAAELSYKAQIEIHVCLTQKPCSF